jgi:hypothetical protein
MTPSCALCGQSSEWHKGRDLACPTETGERFVPMIPDDVPSVYPFRKLWSECQTISEKLSFLAVFRYVLTLKENLQDVGENSVRLQEHSDRRAASILAENERLNQSWVNMGAACRFMGGMARTAVLECRKAGIDDRLPDHVRAWGEAVAAREDDMEDYRGLMEGGSM